jgi:predicted regulator of Ras-like GTPase activity (Roadblock/LC7/MglB family)
VPFQYLLTNLLVDIRGAHGAVFIDPEGEAVELVSRRSTPYELKLEGAYNGIFLRKAADLARLVGAGQLAQLTLAGHGVKVLSRVLRSGYALVVVVDGGAPLAVAAAAMERASTAFNHEIP